MLPAVGKDDGKYGHLIVSRAGKVIGVKSGFRYDGSRVPTGITESEERYSDINSSSVKLAAEIELTPE